MSFASLNGQRIVSGSITVPYYGAWVGDVVLAVASAIPTQTTLVMGDLSMACGVFRSASFTASRSARIVGGFGGWRKNVPAQAYQSNGGVKLSLVLRDVAAICGEQINIPSDANLGTTYVREAATGERSLRLAAGPCWYVDTNGVTQVASRPTGAITSPFTVVEFSGAKGRFDIATETYSDWLPGRSFKNATVTIAQLIGMTTYTLDNEGKLRLSVLSAGAADV